MEKISQNQESNNLESQIQKDKEAFADFIKHSDLFSARSLYRKVPELSSHLEDKEIKNALIHRLQHSIQYSLLGVAEGLKEEFPLSPEVIYESLKQGLEYPINQADFSRIKDYVELFDISREDFISILREIPTERLIHKIPEDELINKIFGK